LLQSPRAAAAANVHAGLNKAQFFDAEDKIFGRAFVIVECAEQVLE